MARMSENTVREIDGGALEFVVPLYTPHRMLVRVVKAHFPNAPSDMRWSVASSVRTRDQAQSRTTFAGYPAKLRVDAREDEINTNTVPCVIDTALNTPWYNAIIIECESAGQRGCEPGRGWFVDLAFDPYEPRATTTTTTATATPAPAPSSATSTTAATNNAPHEPRATTTPAPAASSATAATNNAPVSVVVSVAQGTARTFMRPYCHTTTPYAYASQANLRRHITRCH